MTQEQIDFEKKYHFKVVKPLGNHYQIPIKEYIVTSALLDWENDETIFAIKALDYNLENKHWITIRIGKDEFDKCINDFEVIEDGYEKYVKPVILDEVLNTWIKKEGDEWIAQYSSYIFPEKTGFSKFRLDKRREKEVFEGLNEYMFIYKSIYDLDKPSVYFVKLPDIEYKEDVLQYVEPFRKDVLDNKIAYGVNSRLLYGN